MKIIIGIYLISWVVAYLVSIEKKPFVTFKDVVEERGIFGTILIHLIIPLVVLQSLLSLIIDCLKIIDKSMQDLLDEIIE